MLSIFITNIIIHVGVMALFLTIFFFTIAVYFEKKIVEKQVDFVIEDFIGNLLKPLSDSDKEKVQNEILSSLEGTDYTEMDNSVDEQNNKIIRKAWTFVGILVGIIIFIIILLGFYFKWNFYFIKFLGLSSLYTLIFVGITETLFLFLIAQNYLSADPMKIKLNLFETLYKNTCDPCTNTKDCIGSSIAECSSTK
tara:strand:+ start:3989 stop:4573 length:585 start_codon:yes stop_codon:yes gene_type:complete